MSVSEPIAVVGGQILTDLVDVTDDLAALDRGGPWVVVVPFDASPICARFARRRPGTIGDVASADAWPGLPAGTRWDSSLDRAGFVAAVETIRAAIGRGELTQANLTRRISAPLPDGADVVALAAAVAAANPAPHEALVSIPALGVAVASASPESFLSMENGRVSSSPIKGTTTSGGTFPPKDYVENRLVTALAAEELANVCVPGSVRVVADCSIEAHPGLDHLVSTVAGVRRPDLGWADILAELVPPASVTGAPRAPARRLIDQLEPVARGPYCGAIGLVDDDRARAVLNVAIRTFWFADDHVHFGTGAGITAGSDPVAEWDETELKAARLLAVAAAAGGRLPV